MVNALSLCLLLCQADDTWGLLQYETKLYLIDVLRLTRDLFYQQVRSTARNHSVAAEHIHRIAVRPAMTSQTGQISRRSPAKCLMAAC